MKTACFFIALFISFSVVGQTSFSKEEAKKLIDLFFEGFHKGDTVLMRTTLADKVTLQTAFVDAKGNNKISESSMHSLLTAIAGRKETEIWEERLHGFTVQKDGNLSHVWVPYTFYYNGKLLHCGANAFTLANTGKGWKIIHLIDSRRRDCGG
ncbi:MAG: nuclear transport factor 2 family protein [Marinirhabdus sp.]